MKHRRLNILSHVLRRSLGKHRGEVWGLTIPKRRYLSRMLGLVVPGQLANELVAGGEGDDGEEGEQEGNGACYVPGAEDDAEVLRVPCE